MSAIGWVISRLELAELRAAFPPSYIPVETPHCTLALGAGASTQLPPSATGTVIAKAIDPSGLEALIVLVNGETKRPDGGTFHITWSLAPGRRPKESNAVIASTEPIFVDKPIHICLVPARF